MAAAIGLPLESSGVAVIVATPFGTLSATETCKRDLASAYVMFRIVMLSVTSRMLVLAVLLRAMASVALQLKPSVPGSTVPGGRGEGTVKVRVFPVPAKVIVRPAV